MIGARRDGAAGDRTRWTVNWAVIRREQGRGRREEGNCWRWEEEASDVTG